MPVQTVGFDLTPEPLGDTSPSAQSSAPKFGSDHDANLQNRIDSAALRLAYAPTPTARRKAMAELAELKKQQQPERIEELERQRGLR